MAEITKDPRRERLVDELATAYCNHFCANECRANSDNDCCFCMEAAIVGAGTMQHFVSSGYAARLRVEGLNPCPRLVAEHKPPVEPL